VAPGAVLKVVAVSMLVVYATGYQRLFYALQRRMPVFGVWSLLWKLMSVNKAIPHELL
jgi:hypothetical protein